MVYCWYRLGLGMVASLQVLLTLISYREQLVKGTPKNKQSAEMRTTIPTYNALPTGYPAPHNSPKTPPDIPGAFLTNWYKLHPPPGPKTTRPLKNVDSPALHAPIPQPYPLWNYHSPLKINGWKMNHFLLVAILGLLFRVNFLGPSFRFRVC